MARPQWPWGRWATVFKAQVRRCPARCRACRARYVDRRTAAAPDVEINHLLTIRSPNANHWRELDHVGPCDATEVDAFFGRSYPFARLAVRIAAVLRGAKNVTKERLSGQSQPRSRSRAGKTRRTCIRCHDADGSDRRNRSPPF